jgi:hypothetical protein
LELAERQQLLEYAEQPEEESHVEGSEVAEETKVEDAAMQEQSNS